MQDIVRWGDKEKDIGTLTWEEWNREDCHASHLKGN